jgi:Amt family ammonium transporter
MICTTLISRAQEWSDKRWLRLPPIAPAALIRTIRFLLLFVCYVLYLLWPTVAHAQSMGGNSAAPSETVSAPLYWYLMTTMVALLAPIGFMLIGVAGLEPEHAWNAALGGLAAVGLATWAYWAVGFAIQFGGVGLVYPNPELRQLVWEWSPLAANWGIGWGVAGLSGWFLSGPQVTALTYTLFLAHLPWVITAATLPLMAVRGRAPAIVTLLLALIIGGFVYPLAGNWVQGGGWLSALGRNLNLGHGFVDFGGAGTVHLVAAGFALAALVVWAPRTIPNPIHNLELPPVHLPLLVVVGSLFVLAGSLGWHWANPLQVQFLGEIALMRGSVNSILVAAGGLIPPLLYTWFVTGSSEPLTSARGLVAGVVAGLAVGPFVQPGVAFAIGLLAGATVPFVLFLLEGVWRLDDATGAVTASGVPAMVGLLLVGIFADGVVGNGWQMTGPGNYLGVEGQGVSGLFVASGYQLNFPQQLQAQAIGVLALSLWGFVVGMAVCIPLGLLFHALEGSEQPRSETTSVLAPPTMEPVYQEQRFELEFLSEEWNASEANRRQTRR